MPQPQTFHPLPRNGVIAFLLAWPLVIVLGSILSEAVRTHVPQGMLPLCWILAFGLFLRQHQRNGPVASFGSPDPANDTF